MISHRRVADIRCGVVDILGDAAQIARGILSGVSKPKKHLPIDLHNRKRTQSDCYGRRAACGGLVPKDDVRGCA
jgi:hypothetical protein